MPEIYYLLDLSYYLSVSLSEKLDFALEFPPYFSFWE